MDDIERKSRARKSASKWYHANKEKALAFGAIQRERWRIAAINYYSDNDPKCKCCGEREIKFLCIDHVNGDGAQHRRTIGRSVNIYLWLKKNHYPSGFQILCYNCNNTRHYHKVCPHQSYA